MLRMLLITVTLMMLNACGGSGGGGSAAPAPDPGSKPAWTVMVYMDADNDLDLSAPLDLQELMAAGSTANVNLILQYDTRSATTLRYRVEKGKLTLLQDLGEQDMASPASLRDFISTSVTAYPAQRYALILWDHGNGWKSNGKQLYSILQDWTSNGSTAPATANHLIAGAIRDAESQAGLKLDVIGIDACIMATLEVAYEFRDLAGYLASSQDLVQGKGWNYTDLIGRLNGNPAMSGRDLAVAMVDSYRAFVESSAYGYGDQAISAVALGTGMETLAQTVDALARVMTTRMNDAATRTATLQAITAARSTVKDFDGFTYVDLQQFASLLSEGSLPATPVVDALRAVTVATYHGSLRPQANGLSLVFYNLPEAQRFSTYDSNYRNFDSATGSGDRGAFINTFTWDEMQTLYFRNQYPDLVR